MSTAYVSSVQRSPEQEPVPKGMRHVSQARAGLYAFVSLTWLALLTAVALQQFRLPAPAPETVTPDRFSAKRAADHILELAKTPRTPGSAGALRAREYLQQQLSKLGVHAETIGGTVVRSYVAAEVVDVIGTIPGGDASQPALLLSAHYDSVPNSPGASDDASGIAVVLETLRALKASGSHHRTVTALFTDGEELGSLGSQLFAFRFDPAKQIGIVLNFEARGVTGPALIFESSGAEREVLRAATVLAPNCLVGSFSNDAYDLLPNDTDLTTFKRKGVTGLNFSFFGGLVHYHSRHDTPRMLNLGSLQREGDCAVSLARDFADQPLAAVGRERVTYFKIPGVPPVIYGERWAYVAACLVAVAVLGSILRSFSSRRIKPKPIALAPVFWLICIPAVALSTQFVWTFLVAVHPQYRAFPGETYRAWIYWLALLSFALAAFTALYATARKFISAAEMWAGILCVCVVLDIVLLKGAPNSSYLLTWPLLFSAVAFMLAPAAGTRNLRELSVVSLAAVAPILFLAPTILLLLYALSLGGIQGTVATLLVLSGLLIPQFEYIRSWRPWAVPMVTTAVFAICCLAGNYLVRADPEQKQPDSLFYAECAGCGGAVWGTLDGAPDRWTKQFVQGGRASVPCHLYLPGSTHSCMFAPARTINVPSPSVTLVSHQASGPLSVLNCRITSRRRTDTLFVDVEPGDAVISSEVNANSIQGRRAYGRYTIRYYGDTSSVEVKYVVKTGVAVKMRVTDLSYGLPVIAGQPSVRRPDYLAASNDLWSDALLSTGVYQF